jgi:DNA-binding response OmpR family regulator
MMMIGYGFCYAGFLRKAAFRVTDVGSASEARKALDGLVFDVLIIDIMMPGETGLEFLADIRKDNPVPCLVSDGHVRDRTPDHRA